MKEEAKEQKPVKGPQEKGSNINPQVTMHRALRRRLRAGAMGKNRAVSVAGAGNGQCDHMGQNVPFEQESSSTFVTDAHALPSVEVGVLRLRVRCFSGN